jgi:hypothetical protein
MRYTLLIYADQSSWADLSDEEKARRRAEEMPRWGALFEELQKADPDVSGYELDEAHTARVVRVRDGERIVTDGPFAETKEAVGGFGRRVWSARARCPSHGSQPARRDRRRSGRCAASRGLGGRHDRLARVRRERTLGRGA